MRPSERRNKIMERLSFRRHDTMQNLADEFGVSWDTIHRDILYLEAEYPIIVIPGRGGGVRLSERLAALQCGSPRSSRKLKAVTQLLHQPDMDLVPGLSDFDRRLVCVPEFCAKDCTRQSDCQYHRYLQFAMDKHIAFQICNHNYLLADASHRLQGLAPLLQDSAALVVDEAHKLPEAARQMYSQSLGAEDMETTVHLLEREHFTRAAQQLRERFSALLAAFSRPKDSRESQAVYLPTSDIRAALADAAHGHALVLFTSYRLMDEVHRLTKDKLPYATLQAWRGGQRVVQEFKTMPNAVLFAAGPCWEGIDFPGDIVSLLVITRLPFPIPDALSNAEKAAYPSLPAYIRAEVVPEMQKKLRQGFGRAIRTETDTCIVSLLDRRAAPGGRYHAAALQALPPCPQTDSLEDVRRFIHARKKPGYFVS